MSEMTAEMLVKCYSEACTLDVAALKPGNVSFHSKGRTKDAELFLQSAQASAEVIAKPDQILGERIYGAVKATRKAARCNTNLGIILLCAPIIQAVFDYPGESLKSALVKVLSVVRADETNCVYSAIRLANPGGLGRTELHDVSGPTTSRLVDVMSLAADRDLIARQYVNGYHELCNVVLPYLTNALQRHADEESAVSDLFLYLLESYQDSHIQRKQGAARAIAVSRWVAGMREKYLAAGDDQSRHLLLLEMDQQLKQQGINPGTTADFCVAGVFIHRLREQTINSAGVARNYPRTIRSIQAESPLIT